MPSTFPRSPLWICPGWRLGESRSGSTPKRFAIEAPHLPRSSQTALQPPFLPCSASSFHPLARPPARSPYRSPARHRAELQSPSAALLVTPQYRPPDARCRRSRQHRHRRRHRLQGPARRSPVPAACSGTGRLSSAPAGSGRPAKGRRGVCTTRRRWGAIRKPWRGGEQNPRRPWRPSQRCAPRSAAAAAPNLTSQRGSQPRCSLRDSSACSASARPPALPVSSSAGCPRSCADSLRVQSPTGQGLAGYRAPYKPGLYIRLAHANFLSSPSTMKLEI